MFSSKCKVRVICFTLKEVQKIHSQISFNLKYRNDKSFTFLDSNVILKYD